MSQTDGFLGCVIASILCAISASSASSAVKSFFTAEDAEDAEIAQRKIKTLRDQKASTLKFPHCLPDIQGVVSGLLHALLGVANQRDLEHHPKVGGSWEGYAVEEVLKAMRPDDAYYWATHSGAEIDLVLFKGGRRIGIECKRADAPRLTPSMRIALEDLKLDQLLVVYPGDRRYPLGKWVEAMPLAELVGPAAKETKR